MRRRLFTFFSALSLLVCLAVCVLWVRSYWVGDDVRVVRWDVHSTPKRAAYAAISSESGNLLVMWGGYALFDPRLVTSFQQRDDKDYPIRLGPIRLAQARTRSRPAMYGLTHFEFSRRDSTNVQLDMRSAALAFPQWLAIGLAAISPSAWIASVVRRRSHRAAGHCPSCGYDLRATPERCPECGRATA